MTRIAQLDPSRATGKSKEIFDAAQARHGRVPNLVSVLGSAPAALEGFWGLSQALQGGVLGAGLREQIALTVAEINYCGYSLSAHASLGAAAGLSELEIAYARWGVATDAHAAAILDLVRGIALQRGVLSDAELKAARAANVTDAEIVETVANVALNVLTNYLNHVAQTPLDFPEVQPGGL